MHLEHQKDTINILQNGAISGASRWLTSYMVSVEETDFFFYDPYYMALFIKNFYLINVLAFKQKHSSNNYFAKKQT